MASGNIDIYLIRHAEAAGQAADAPLTGEGMGQAEALGEFLSGLEVGQIVSSPFVRAVRTIEPLADRLGIGIKLDDRLIEAALGTVDHPDWLDKLRETFLDFALSFEGGESSQEATTRAIDAIDDALRSDPDRTVVVTHGRLMTLILKHFDPKYGFEEWRDLTTPDVFRIVINDDAAEVVRIWG